MTRPTTPGDAGPRRTRAFISYSRKDVEFVARLRAALDANGYDSLVDTEDISGGEEWKKRLDQLILAADAVVFIISPDSVASSICDWETKRALELGKRLIPVLWRPLDASPPAQLAERNYIFFDAPERFESALSQLCNACDVDIGWVREHTRLVELASRWYAGGRRRDALLRGEERTAADAWLKNRMPRAPEIPEVLVAYLQASQVEERRRARQRRRTQVAVGLLVFILAGAGVAFATQDRWRPQLDAWWNYKRFVHSAEDLRVGPTGAESAFQDCSPSMHCPTMVVIPEGSAMIGAAEDDPELPPSQGYALPLQQVTMPRFAVSQHEITWADWRACVAARRCPELERSGWEGDDRPVINVSWLDARAYADWLKEMTGEDYRLLTEQEWEYAARAVTSAQAAPTRFSWGDEDPVRDTTAANGAAFFTREQQGTWPAGSFQANAFGLYDMHGNVWEWTETCYGNEQSSEQSDAETSECSSRVRRGGSWFDDRQDLRSAGRNGLSPTYRINYSGFRVARTL